MLFEVNSNIETKPEQMSKSGKKVEFSNKVTEQIISESNEGSEHVKQEPVIKEVDFDIKFLDRSNENEAKKNADKVKQSTKPAVGKPTTTNTQPGATKPASKSPPPKVKSAPVAAAKSAKAGSKSSSVKESAASIKEELKIETPLVTEEVTPKVVDDPMARVRRLANAFN